MSVPKNSKSNFEVAGCFCMYDGKILLMERTGGQREGGKWGFPAGKVESGEDALSTAVRELKEETDIDVLPQNMLFIHKAHVKYPDTDFIIHMFHTKLAAIPDIKLDLAENIKYVWVYPHEAFKLDLVRGNDNLLEVFISNSDEKYLTY